MNNPYVTNRTIALATHLGPLGKIAFRGYNCAAKRLRRPLMSRTYFGADILCDPNDYIQRMILSFGFWEPHISAYIQQALQPGDAFIDVGANIGYHTLLVSKQFGSRAAVVAIEAAPRTFELLQRNLARNQCENVLAVNVAASDRQGQVDLFSSHSLGDATTRAERGLPYSATVPCAPLSDIIPLRLQRDVKLIKIDIEGGEIPVMHNLLANLDRFAPNLEVLVEASVETLRAEWAHVVHQMRGHGFSTYKITNEYDDTAYLTWRRVIPPLPFEELPHTQCDILFTRRTGSGR